MEVTVEDVTGLERRVRVHIPEQKVAGEVDRRLDSMAGNVRLPGFRPGKAPKKVLAQRFGRQVRDEVVGEMVQSSFYEALSQEKLRPAGSPTIDAVDAEPGNGISYTAVFDVYPEVETPPVESLEIRRPVAGVAEADVDAMIETLRRQRRAWEPVERAATPDDRVVVDFEGTVDGEPLEGGSATELAVELSGEGMLPGFEDGLVGMTAGEEKTLDLRFPEDYRQDELAGRPVRFRVRAHRVEEPVLPEIDEALARSFGIEEGGVEGLRREVRENMERELDDAVRATLKRRVMDALLQGRALDLPRAMIDEEAARLLAQRRTEIEHSGIDPSTVELDPAMFEEQARTRVSLGLLLAEMIRAHDIQPDPERVRERIERIASTYQQPDEVINWYYGNRDRLSEVESTVLEDQVVDWVLEHARVVDEPSSFDALLNPGQT